MPARRSNSSDDENSDDLAQEQTTSEAQSQSPNNRRGSSTQNAESGEGFVPRPKRIACILCRKRKLRCDGNKPSCGTCSRLGHECAYDEVRKKSGPKRGYVKLLEARLKQVETLLGSREPADQAQPSTSMMQDVSQPASYPQGPDIALGGPSADVLQPGLSATGFSDHAMDSMVNDLSMGGGEYSWDMISLGIEEPLPGQDIINDLNQIYFEKIHPSLPIIHRPRFLASMDLTPAMRPPIALRYAMWTMACSISPQYASLLETFYARARKYAELDELRGHGESMITLAHAQCWELLATFEFKMMFFPRAWMSCGRATRLSQMMALHRQDGVGLDVKQCLPPARDWTEREERRRTFWMAFCNDRYASIGTGWPFTIDEKDILTNLPASEEAFTKSNPEKTFPLSRAMDSDGASTLSPFGAVVLMACLFGRNLTHLHRPNENDRDHDLNGDFWKRHHSLENILLNTSLSLPSHLRLPAGITDSNIVFLNMNIHTSTICLHQAAIFKADKNRMPTRIGAESKRRCIIAADQITNIMKMISHTDLDGMNPFMAFSLYVAARVFVQYLKSKKDDQTIKSSLHFLLSAMQALKLKNPLTESFLVQLDVDLEGSGLDIPTNGSRYLSSHKPQREVPLNTDAVKCVPLFEIRSSQLQGENGPEPAPTQATSLQDTDDTLYHRLPLGFTQITSNTNDLLNRPRQLFQSSSVEGEIFGNVPGLSEMDLFPDGSSGDRNHSDHPTPSTASNKGSSNTSFTSPHFDESSHTNYPATSAKTSPNTTANTAAAVFFDDPDSFAQFPLRLADLPEEIASGGMNNSFAMPASWDYSTGVPNNTGTGMKDNNLTGSNPGTGTTPMPMGDASWHEANVLEGQEWMFSNWNGVDPPQQ